MPAKQDRYLVTCEHGGNRVPAVYQPLFSGHEDLLDSHRGWDPGALTLARELARALDAPLFYATVSRLVIDLNRSVGHPRLYSEITRSASRKLRQEIFDQHYLPYRSRVERFIEEEAALGHSVMHISSHSFTPVMNGEERNADIGLLYDPTRMGESVLVRQWQAALKLSAKDLRVRRNYPYTGKSDGFTAYLRRRFQAATYVGIELEINQKHVLQKGREWPELRLRLIGSLLNALAASKTFEKRSS